MPSNSFIMAGAALLGMAIAQTAPLSTAGTSSKVTKATGMYPITSSATSSPSIGTGITASPTVIGPVGTTGSPSAVNNTGEAVYCPRLSGEVILDGHGIYYAIGCGVTHFGSFIDVNINITLAKRAEINNLGNCIDVCSTVQGCVGTSFNKNSLQCAFYSAVGAETADAAYDFALVTNPNAVTVVPSGSPITTPVVTPTTYTVSACPVTVTNCPLNAAGQALVTGNAVAYTTVCPCTQNGGCTVASVAACPTCAYSVGTATVYSQTTVSGTTTVVPVATAKVAIPSGGATTNGGTVTATITCTSSECKAVATASTTGVQAFTGAAASVKAGMGMAAVMAIIALVL